MRLAVLGKVGSVIHWLEDCVAALRGDGHQVLVAATRNPAVNQRIEDLLLWERIGAPMAEGIARRVARFRPDLILVIGAYEIPSRILERIAALPGRPPLFAWIGDAFSEAAGPIANLFDAVAYTDSGLLERHGRLGFAPPSLFLPHAANPAPAVAARSRRPRMMFVANPTPHRRAVVEAVDHPMAIYGPAWSTALGHEINRRKVGPRELFALYAGYLAALNIRNENNILVGLNQRNFDPCVQSTPVVTDPQPDLERCFDPQSEVLVYRSTDELNAHYDRLRRYPTEAAELGAAGRRRVLADHTYGRRLAQLGSVAGSTAFSRPQPLV